MRKLIAVMFVIALSAPLGACFDSLSDSVERLAGIPGQAVRSEIEEGMTAAEANETAAINEWVEETDPYCSVAEAANCNAMTLPVDQANCLAACGGES